MPKSLLLNGGVDVDVKEYRETQRTIYCSGEWSAKNKKIKIQLSFVNFAKSSKKLKKLFSAKSG